MPGFLYFADGYATAVTHEQIAAWGLRYAFPAGCAITSCQASHNTPSDGRGTTFGSPERHRGKTIQLVPGEQVWRQMPETDGRPKLWVGFWRDAKPTADDLVRADPVELPGLPMRLDDGGFWVIPNVRRYDEGEQVWRNELPSHWDFDLAGRITNGKPAVRYRHLWEVTKPIAEGIEAELSGGQSEATEEERNLAVVELLKANYLVDLPEIVVLELILCRESPQIMMQFACQKAELISWLDANQKKRDRAEQPGSTIVDGETD